MPRMTGQAVSVAANSVSANQVAGQLYEFLANGQPLMLSAASSAAGINCTLLVGGVALINDQPISQANRFPIIPDDVATKYRGRGGRIVLTFRNTTGGALTVNWAVDVG
jgi:hypothetical protein